LNIYDAIVNKKRRKIKMSAFYGIQPALYNYKGNSGSVTTNNPGTTAIFPSLTTYVTNFTTLPTFSSTSSGSWTVPSTGVWMFIVNGACNPGSFCVNIYVSTLANGDAATNNRANILFDNGSGAATNYVTRSGSSFLSKGDVLTLQISSTSSASTSMYLSMLGIYQLTRTV
jgi:hypothetical protein